MKTMHDELINKLHHCANEVFCNKCPYSPDCSGEKTIIREAADAIEELLAELEYTERQYDLAVEDLEKIGWGEWIPVTERLPEIKEHYVSDTVLVYLDDGGMSFSKLEENIFSQAWFDIERTSPDGESDYTVTHWMPLPQPPESEGET